MKKLMIFSVLALIAFAGCKKKVSTVSQVVTVSYPKITITSGQYFSVPVGGALPNANTIKATAVDTFYGEHLTPVIDASHLSSVTPGLYVATVSAKNKYGFVGYAYVYVAVTDVSDAMDLSGLYLRDNAPDRPAVVTKLARGLYLTNNVGGVDTGTQASSILSAVFAVTSDSTIDLGMQNTSAGTLTASQQTLSLIPSDTTYAYALSLPGFGTQLRTFVKQ